MERTGRDDPGSASEKRSEKHLGPFEGCAEWFERIRQRFESSGAEMDCCEAMAGLRRAEREAEKGDT